ncbi:hypothetical protein HY483_01280 [Candidatus Woesearchaeota archaeon]|nr:hypothetical protein [Candidatus Woesearchaeota archaeon]
MKKVIEFVGVLILIFGIILVAGIFKNSNTPITDFEIKYNECLNMQRAESHVEAIQKNNPKLCDNSFDPEMCKAKILGNSSFCEGYEGVKKDYCKGTITGNINFCGTSGTCKAEVLKNPALCLRNKSVEDDSFSDRDCKILAGEKSDSEEFCYDTTWSDLAFMKYDSSLCSNILNDDSRKSCETKAQ